MEYQLIGENADGSVTIRISDGKDVYDKTTILPPLPTRDDQIAEFVQAQVDAGLSGTKVITNTPDLPNGMSVEATVDPVAEGEINV